MKYRAILDTNVVVAALSSRRGASFVLLNHAINKRFALLASPALWLEYEAVLKRPEMTKMHLLTPQDIDDVLRAYSSRRVARQVMMPHAKCSMAKKVSGNFSHRTKIRRKRFIQL